MDFHKQTAASVLFFLLTLLIIAPAAPGALAADIVTELITEELSIAEKA